MRCAACKAAALRELPPNQFSRHPGYVCTDCRAIMRPPGSTGSYIIITILSGVVVLFGLLMLALAFLSGVSVRRLLFVGVGLAGMGISGAAWAITQLRFPVPLDAPVRPSRLWLWIILVLVGLLVVGGGLFLFAYFLHEM